MAIKHSKQNWEAGSLVKVGFMSLVVLAVVPSPGDHRPDQYLLRNAKGDHYAFVPHFGCHKLTEADVQQMRAGRHIEI